MSRPSQRPGVCPEAALGWQAGAFTIIEMLAAMVILMIILGVIFGLTQQAGNAWRSSSSKIESMQGARAAFDMITENLGQATLNNYYDYLDASGKARTPANASAFAPASYGLYSDLHFISGKSLIPSQVGHAVFFQTPAGYSGNASLQGLDTLMNACGFYVRFDKDDSRPMFLDSLPNAPADRYRFRLYRFLQPSEQLAVFADRTGNDWFTQPLSGGSRVSTPVAENIVALVIRPRQSDQAAGAELAPDFEYDSRDASFPAGYNLLPPLVDVVMVAIDEASARKLEHGATPPDLGVSALFQSADSLDDDIKTLETALANRHLTYRVFRTTVALRNSKRSS